MSDKLQPVNWLICDPNIEVTLPDVTQPQPCRQPAAAQLLKTRAGFRLQNGEQRWEQQLHGFWISSQVNRRGAETIIFSILELSVRAHDPRPNRQGSLTPTSLAVICLFVTIWAVYNNRDFSKFYWGKLGIKQADVLQISNITDVNCQVLCGLCYSGWMGGKRKNEENFRGKHSRRWFAEEWKQRKLYSRTENIKRNAREKYLKVSEINVPKVLFCLGHSNAVRNYSPGRNLYLLSSINI